MTRVIFFIYGVVCHVLFLALYVYLAIFFSGVPVIPKTVDAPVESGPGPAIGINAALVLAFALQHSVMARPGFKAVWTRLVPPPIERSTYVLFSCLCLIGLMAFWQPIDLVVWDLPQGPARWVAWAFFISGWLLVPAVTFMISHFDLFGTRQVWLHVTKRTYTSLPFRTPSLYRRVRHPLYVGWAIAFWATPTMTAGHLALAATLTLYMLVAVIFEERDLVAHFGQVYDDYRRQVPMFIPLPGRRAGVERPEPSDSRAATLSATNADSTT